MDAPALEQPADLGTILVGIDAFGLSRHSNHTVVYRQRNPGLGLTLGVIAGEQLDWVTSVGTYLDSYDNRAHYAMSGLRAMFGERSRLHWGAAVEMGYLDGSGVRGLGMIPVVQLGYDRVSLCITGDYEKASGSSPHTQPNPYRISTAMIAAFLEFEVVRW
jgi:hypothetical protein